MKTHKHIIRSVSSLIPYARNARTHSDAQVAQLAASIREFGFTSPVVIDEDGGILAGHGRVMALRKLGVEEVPCIEAAGLTQAQRRAYVLADNKLALNAGWDEDLLRVELEELTGLGFDLDLTGFDEAEVDALLAQPDFAPGTEEDQGKLDELAPKMVVCPHCRTAFDAREHEQG
jgi:ParB-like chromosome segregation protein Spo0J